MLTTDMMEWPAPVWPPSRLEESKQTLASEPDGAFHVSLAWIRILSAAGDLEGARLKLATLRTASESRRFGGGELRQVIPLALLVHDQASAQHFLASVFPTTFEIDFAVAKTTHHSVVSMRVTHRSVTFIMSDSLFSNQHGEILLQRLIDVYPVLAYYFESSMRTVGTVAINLGDAGDRPGLAFCDNRPGYFLIPDSIFMDTRGYIGMRKRFAKEIIPWEKRSPIAFWRGTTTGQPADGKRGWRSLPRVTLCEIGADNLDLIDAGITKVLQIEDPIAEAWIAEAGLLRPFVAPESFQQYRYQIDIDGNTTSWPGLFMKLLTGSVVLKVPPRDGFEQWYYHRLKPWVNFIPLLSDMSDLPDKVRWLRANDAAARSIGEAGYRLAEELTYEREIGRAAPTVAAAMRDARGAPLLEFDFAVGGGGTAYLREGWLPPERDGVYATGFQSRIDLPRPCGIGGFVVCLDLSSATSGNQRLSIVLDGEVMAQLHIGRRTTVYVPLARKMLKNKPSIALTLLHPDAVPAASAASPADARMLAVRLHRLAVVGCGRNDTDAPLGLGEALSELRAMDRGDQAHDLNGPAPLIPSHADLLPLYTHHGTLAYADTDASRLRHGPADAVPHNLFVAVADGDGVLVRMTATGQRRTVRLRPEGRFAGDVDRVALNAEGRADRFTLVSVESTAGAAIALRAAGLVLCAEGAGNLELGRVKIGPWEQFRSTFAVA
ncbi:glycosyl transferase family 90 [Acidisphaera sp. S103]|uniref:glycosyl transferase family 90 n=1 Tax=Acidisphaera sp. S103 TaxID=1747223 RepID=UPI00131C1F1F|nr:glycosyl transferase family 90 [Acidisphaera sp. S103]